MTDEEYISIFLELLRYVHYLKEEKAKIQIFISGLQIKFKEGVEFDEPISLEDAILKLKHYYKQSKRISKTKIDMKENNKNKGKWHKKRARPQDKSNKENAIPHKKFNTYDRGQEICYKQNKGDDRKPVQCWTCGKHHRQRYFPQHQGGRLQIYNAQEAQTVGDVEQSVPMIYATLDNR